VRGAAWNEAGRPPARPVAARPRLAFTSELLALGEQPDDLFRSVAASFHVVESSILPILGIGLAQLVDQFTGTGSSSAEMTDVS
jgi:hypothetical protein